MTETKKRRKRTTYEIILSTNDFREYESTLEWLKKEAHKHARTPAQEAIFILMQRQSRHLRQGVGGRFVSEKKETPA